MSYINSNLNFPNADELIEYLIGRVDNISISAHSYLDQEDVEKLDALSLELAELKAKQTKDIEDVKKLIDNIELTGTPIDVSGLKSRIEALEAKTDKDTVYDDSEVKRRISELEAKPAVNTDQLVTKDELAKELAKDVEVRFDEAILNDYLKSLDAELSYVKKTELSTQPSFITLSNRVTSLETRPSGNGTAYDDSELRGRVENLENRPEYNDTEIKQRLGVLEAKTDNDTIYNDTEVKQRLTALEEKTDKDTVYDDSALKTRVEALEQRPAGNGTAYDDTEVKNRLTALETKPDKDTVYDDSALKARVEALEQRPAVNTENLVTKDQLATGLANKLTSADLSGLLTKTQADNDYATKQELQALSGGSKSEYIEGTVAEWFAANLNPGYKLKKDSISSSTIHIVNENRNIFKADSDKTIHQCFYPARGTSGLIGVAIGDYTYYVKNDNFSNNFKLAKEYQFKSIPLTINSVIPNGYSRD